MSLPRAAIELELVARGFSPWPAVTKKVALVVAADPDSLSGKARKARDYGIPVVGESALWVLLGA
jgi:DNA polymerase-3 subunit epsilon